MYMNEARYTFLPMGGAYPYIQKLFAHAVDAGFIEFDGYFYAKQEDLPVECIMEYSTDVYSAYIIEVTRFENLEETSVYSEMEDDDGHMMRVCFFPTHHIKLWYRIREQII
jgi:hypothetical protein